MVKVIYYPVQDKREQVNHIYGKLYGFTIKSIENFNRSQKIW